MNGLLAAAFVLKEALFPTDTPEAERLKALKPYFSPSPGTLVSVDPRDLQAENKNDLERRGYIIVTPPKGRCFIVQRHPERPDDRICKKTVLSFTLGELNAAGEISWQVITGKDDFGTKLTWPTPHRLIQVIPAGGYAKSRNRFVPLAYCHVARERFRTIYAGLTDGSRWVLSLPEKDKLVTDQPKPYPNLYIHKPDGDGESAFAPDDKKSKKDTSNWTETYRWQTKVRGSYEMPSSHLLIGGSPEGLRGTCRYRFRDAPHDAESGVIECINTDVYDVVYAHLPCLGELAPPK